MARRTKQEAAETRISILNAALDIIYDKGYARSTFVDIANQINLTKGAVYWHFKSKPDLIIALGRHIEEKIETSLHDLYSGTDTISDLKRMFYEIIQLIVKDEQLRKYYAIVFYRMEWTDELLRIRDFFDRQDEKMMDFVINILKEEKKKFRISEHMDIKSTARALLAIVDGLLGFCLSKPGMGNNDLSQPVQIGLDTFFLGLTSGEKTTPCESR